MITRICVCSSLHSKPKKMSTYRSEMKKLLFQKTQELKKCKSATEKANIQEKYKLLEDELNVSREAPTVDTIECVVKSPSIGVSSGPVLDEPPSFYACKSVSRSANRRKQRDLHAQSLRESLGDGSEELRLQEEEMSRIIAQITQHGKNIFQIQPDGDCLFAAIAIQLQNVCSKTLRNLVADYLQSNREEFEPFITIDFDEYCNDIRESLWGSDIEVEIISRIYKKPVWIFNGEANIVKFGIPNEKETICLTYHQRQYTSPHYNAALRDISQ